MPNVDRTFFMQNFPSGALSGKTLNPGRAEGFISIFDCWDALASDLPLPCLAYALATAWHETGATMQPVREGFARTDADAFAHVTAYCLTRGIPNYAARDPNGNSYYGRGYVQLTHARNYRTMGQRLGAGDALYDNPDDVMHPATAARILLLGMIDGLFRPTKGKLADYFSAVPQRWFEARELINGDKNVVPKWAAPRNIGTLIGEYGQAFSGVLR